MLLRNDVHADLEHPKATSCLAGFKHRLPDSDVAAITDQDGERPALMVETALAPAPSTACAMSATTVYHSALASPPVQQCGGPETPRSSFADRVLMSRSDSGFGDGDGQGITQEAEEKQPKKHTSNGEAKEDQPKSRRSSTSRQGTRPSNGRRGSQRPSSSRAASSAEKRPSRSRTSASTSPDKSPASSIRSSPSHQASRAKRATLSNGRSFSFPPPTSIDIELALAAHRKSCQLFQSLGETVTSSPQSRVSKPASPAAHIPSPSPSKPQHQATSTVILWTSHATRRAEYAAIDRQHRGVRGLVRRCLPSCLHRRLFSASARRGFYAGATAAEGPTERKKSRDDDADSVRRYRIDVPGDEEDDDDDPASEGTAREKAPERTVTGWRQRLRQRSLHAHV